jgi:DNA-binding NarL/FixJ family response regulator
VVLAIEDHGVGLAITYRPKAIMAATKHPISSPQPKRILIVDDHPIVRQGLARLVRDEPDLVVCGEAENAREGRLAIGKHKPDLVVVGISLSGKTGLALIKDLRAQYPQLPVLVMSMHDEQIYAERALRAGGRGYIMKQAGGKILMEAIRHVLRGQVYVSSKVSARILDRSQFP